MDEYNPGYTQCVCTFIRVCFNLRLAICTESAFVFISNPWHFHHKLFLYMRIPVLQDKRTNPDLLTVVRQIILPLFWSRSWSSSCWRGVGSHSTCTAWVRPRITFSSSLAFGPGGPAWPKANITCQHIKTSHFCQHIITSHFENSLCHKQVN